MKRFLLILLALVPLLASAEPATELAGRFVLQGARATGSTLLLKDDGRFEETYAYGNLDGHIQGGQREATVNQKTWSAINTVAPITRFSAAC